MTRTDRQALRRRVLYCGHSTQYSHLVPYVFVHVLLLFSFLIFVQSYTTLFAYDIPGNVFDSMPMLRGSGVWAYALYGNWRCIIWQINPPWQSLGSHSAINSSVFLGHQSSLIRSLRTRDALFIADAKCLSNGLCCTLVCHCWIIDTSCVGYCRG